MEIFGKDYNIKSDGVLEKAEFVAMKDIIKNDTKQLTEELMSNIDLRRFINKDYKLYNQDILKSSNISVYQVQKQLNTVLGINLTTDGNFGSGTFLALVKFQKKVNDLGLTDNNGKKINIRDNGITRGETLYLLFPDKYKTLNKKRGLESNQIKDLLFIKEEVKNNNIDNKKELIKKEEQENNDAEIKIEEDEVWTPKHEEIYNKILSENEKTTSDENVTQNEIVDLGSIEVNSVTEVNNTTTEVDSLKKVVEDKKEKGFFSSISSFFSKLFGNKTDKIVKDNDENKTKVGDRIVDNNSIKQQEEKVEDYIVKNDDNISDFSKLANLDESENDTNVIYEKNNDKIENKGLAGLYSHRPEYSKNGISLCAGTVRKNMKNLNIFIPWAESNNLIDKINKGGISIYENFIKSEKKSNKKEHEKWYVTMPNRIIGNDYNSLRDGEVAQVLSTSATTNGKRFGHTFQITKQNGKVYALDVYCNPDKNNKETLFPIEKHPNISNIKKLVVYDAGLKVSPKFLSKVTNDYIAYNEYDLNGKVKKS